MEFLLINEFFYVHMPFDACVDYDYITMQGGALFGL